MARSHFLSPLLASPSSGHVLVNVDRDTRLASSLETAFDSETRRRGLLGRDGMAGDAALVIAPCGGVHTFSMRFAIDVIFAKKDGTVVKTSPGLRPWRVAVAIGAFAVIEGPLGLIERSGTRPGDRLAVLDS
jgi:hypothetical protein